MSTDAMLMLCRKVSLQIVKRKQYFLKALQKLLVLKRCALFFLTTDTSLLSFAQGIDQIVCIYNEDRQKLLHKYSFILVCIVKEYLMGTATLSSTCRQ